MLMILPRDSTLSNLGQERNHQRYLAFLSENEPAKLVLSEAGEVKSKDR
ncbi:MAG: hypothetical protein V2J07_08795 [Anaerolineae bacterium]|jgi:hypothetical protein|nr:hypothetical protein [Anaerolineae bacterium]